jgi:phospholipid-transporting ATPase
LEEEVALDYSNFALRGCSLKNTEFIVGVAVYVGADTRIMRNSTQSRPKKSDLEM